MANNNNRNHHNQNRRPHGKRPPNDGPRAAFALITARGVLLDDNVQTDWGSKLNIVPYEILDHDRTLTDDQVRAIIGQEIRVSKTLRNAAVTAEPIGGREFKPKFQRDEDGPHKSPPTKPGTEFYFFMRLLSPNDDSGSVDQRSHVLSWVAVDDYQKVLAECKTQNDKIPELREQMAAQTRTLWRMTSEATKIDLEWAFPAKIHDALREMNENAVPIDAVWFKRDPDVAATIAAEKAKNPGVDVSLLIKRSREGIKSDSRPAELVMMRVGNFRNAAPVHKGPRLDAETAAVLEKHRHDGKVLAETPTGLAALDKLNLTSTEAPASSAETQTSVPEAVAAPVAAVSEVDASLHAGGEKRMKSQKFQHPSRVRKVS